MAATPYKQLEQEWQRLHAFSGALSLLRWDAAVMMPLRLIGRASGAVDSGSGLPGRLRVVDTAQPSPEDITEAGSERRLAAPTLQTAPRSVVVLRRPR